MEPHLYMVLGASRHPMWLQMHPGVGDAEPGGESCSFKLNLHEMHLLEHTVGRSCAIRKNSQSRPLFMHGSVNQSKYYS